MDGSMSGMEGQSDGHLEVASGFVTGTYSSNNDSNDSNGSNDNDMHANSNLK